MQEQDQEFLALLEAGSLPNHQFHHRDHIRAAWLYVKQRGLPAAESAMEDAVRSLAARHLQAGKFHKTLTVAWVRLVAFHEHCHPSASFEDFVGSNAALLDKELLLRFYSMERLFAGDARCQFVEPDVRALPAR